MPPLFDAARLFRVNTAGAAERVVTRAPRRPRYQVNTAGEASKLPPRPPARPVLHPTRGHVGQNAPRSVMDRLSVPDDPDATIARFARATRRQNVEFHAVVHPLSGRMLSLARGNEIGVGPGLQQHTTTRRRLVALHQRHAGSRPELAARALRALQRQGPLAGPRPIVVHNHPTFEGTQHTRHMPSAADTGGLLNPALRQQNRVVSLVPHAGRGQPKTHETSYGLHDPKLSGRVHRQARHLAQIDAETGPPGMLQRLRRGGYTPLPVERIQHGMRRADYAEQHRAGSQAHVDSALELRRSGGDRVTPIGASYDQLVRDATQPGRRGVPRRQFAREGGFYTRERVYKSVATDKAFAAFGRAARSPRYMLAAHPSGVATGTVAAAATVAPHHSDRGRRLRDATLGAVAGKGGYQLAGHSVKSSARRSVQWHARMSDLPADTEAQRHRKYQIKQEQKMRGAWSRSHGGRPTGADYRDFPLGMTTGEGRVVPHRLGRVFRALGHTHGGRSGVVLSNTAGAAGAVIGYRHARHTGDAVDVGKAASWGYQENRVIPARAVEWATGAALMAYGLPRMQMTGKLIDAGVRNVAERNGEESALKLANRLTRTRSAVHRATAPIEALRGIEQLDHAIAIIPASLRPTAAVALGAALMSHSHPIRKPEFVPVGGA